MANSLAQYIDVLAGCTLAAEVTTANGASIERDAAIVQVIGLAQGTHANGGRVWFIGNGGSAAIASHMANDYTKNGGIRSSAITDAAVLTCLANDFGYENVYAKAIELQAEGRDGLVAISSSGNSPNIINAVSIARKLGCWVVTLSGFCKTNKLRALGDLNFYIDLDNYGHVEVGHLVLLHAILDISQGWNKGDTGTPKPVALSVRTDGADLSIAP
jgi:D-sedoheptulose 7-phosphate isomerase